MKHGIFFAASLAGALAACAMPAGAATLYESGDPYEATTINSIYEWAERVTFADHSIVTGIEGNFFSESYDPETVYVTVYDGDTLPGGKVLFFDAFTVPANVFGWYGVSGLSWDLSPGDYWFSFTSPGALDLGTTVSNPGPTAVLNLDTGPDWEVSTVEGIALRIYGEAAPTSAVPEPASWALMIAGFGLAGAAMRRRAALATA
jgi:hypothetical protein